MKFVEENKKKKFIRVQIGEASTGDKGMKNIKFLPRIEDATVEDVYKLFYETIKKGDANGNSKST